MVDPRETARQGNEYTTESREKRTVTIAGVTIELSLDSDRYEQEFIEFVAQQTRIGDYEKFKDAKRRATSDTSASSEPLGGDWVFDGPELGSGLWGNDKGDVVQAEGEALLICGPIGAFKSTLDQHLLLAELGLRSENLLGMDVKPLAEDEKILYIAADRPVQLARGLRRMVAEKEHRGVLNRRLIVRQRPPDLGRTDPDDFLRWIEKQGEDIGSVHIDSLKDTATGIEKADGGQAISANLRAVARDRRSTTVHHNRGATAENKKPKKIDDIYGSVWIPAGMGGVVQCWGTSGELEVEVSSLKTPAGRLAPLRMKVDLPTGSISVVEEVDLLDVFRVGDIITAKDAAKKLYEIAEPERADVERARRELRKHDRTESIPETNPAKWRVRPQDSVRAQMFGPLPASPGEGQNGAADTA